MPESHESLSDQAGSGVRDYYCDGVLPERSDAFPVRVVLGTAADRLRAENERLRAALVGIKARCDRIVAGEYGGLEAALEISNEARRALRDARGASDEESQP